MENFNVVLNQKVTGIYHNYAERLLKMNFENGIRITFFDCALVFDLGIIGKTVTFISPSGTLGMTLELKRIGIDADDYDFMILSRDIKDLENKEEILICYRGYKFDNGEVSEL